MVENRDLQPDASTTDEPIIADSITNPPFLMPPDEAAVDIRLDDSSTLPVPAASAVVDGDEKPPAYSPDTPSGALLAARPQVERKMTPVGSFHLSLPGSLWHSSILFNVNFKILDVWVESAPSADPATSLGPSSPAQASQASTGTGTESLPLAVPAGARPTTTPTVEDFFASKPHPDAVFVPETLEWRLIVDHRKIYRRPAEDAHVMNVDHLYEACGLARNSVRVYETVPVFVPAEEQVAPIPRGGSKAASSVVEDFNSHKCWVTGVRVLSTPPDAITTTIDRELLLRFKEDRRANPGPGLDGQETFVRALRVLVRMVGNAAHGEGRLIVTGGTAMTQKLVYDDIARQIVAQLGWPHETVPADGREAIKPTGLFNGSTESRKLLRTWIELQLWLDHETEKLKEEKPNSTVLSQPNPVGAVTTKVASRDAKPSVQELIAFARDQVDSRYGPVTPADAASYEYLGVSSDCKDELIKLAYLLKLQVNMQSGDSLLSCVENILNTQRQDSTILRELLASERKVGRFTTRDLDKAYEQLHLSEKEIGPVPRGQLPADFIIDNYLARLREAVSKSDASDYHGAKEALRVISLSQGNPPALRQALEAQFEMDAEQAYTFLEVGRDFDDSTVVAVFEIRCSDAPGKKEMLRDALHSVAQDRKSDALLRYLNTGELGDAGSVQDTWQQMPSEDRPAGINNIGNTCYLNSVLQYFFTIREIRKRVFELSAAYSQQNAAFAAAHRPNRTLRIGGRIVSAREIDRSISFVLHLADLFGQLIHTPDLAVTPKRELAYLALVSSRAEEDEVAAADATQPAKVEDIPQPISEEPATISPALTKTTLPPVAEEGANLSISEPESMDLSETQVSASPADAVPTEAMSPTTIDAANIALPPSRAPTMDPKASMTPADVPLPPSRAATFDTRRASNAPPPLPQRPRRTMDTTSLTPLAAAGSGVPEISPTISSAAAIPPPARQNSLMQFGAQQDVSECLDNCLFQLEIALAAHSSAPTDAASPTDSRRMDLDDAASVSSVADGEDLLSKLFLGKTCQQLELVDADPAKGASVHTKKEVFKILPVDVLEEGRDLYDGLDGFFDEETLIGSEGRPVRRTVTLLEPPPLLQIQLQRVQYDRQTMRAFKSQAHLAMYETLYMDRYLDFDPLKPEDQARLEKRKKSREARRKIAALRTRLSDLKPNGKTSSQTLLDTEAMLKELAILPEIDESTKGDLGLDDDASTPTSASQPMDADSQADATGAAAATPSEPVSLLVTDDLLKFLHDESEAVLAETRDAEQTIAQLKQEMTSIWSDEMRAEYCLAAVFMHRGEASHGHYFLNQRKLSAPSPENTSTADGAAAAEQETTSSTWFKYNDSAVSVVSSSEVLRDTSGATPYLVTYVRKDLQDKIGLVDTVQRRIVDVEAQQARELVQRREGHDGVKVKVVPSSDTIKDDDHEDGEGKSTNKKARLSPPTPLLDAGEEKGNADNEGERADAKMDTSGA